MVATRVATGVTEGVSEKDEVVPQMDRSHESGSSSMPVLESDRPVCRENKTESTSWAKVSLKRNEMNKVLLDRYLCPEHFVDIQLDWYDALQLAYDMSVPNVAHLDPQRGGCCTVMPYFFGETLEIPVATTQDYTLFHLVNNYSLELWKAQIDSIVTRNGLVSFIVHPDYVIEEKARGVYRNLLTFLRELGWRQRMWFALPGEIDHWWRARGEIRIVGQDGNWRIEGEGAEHAKLAFARMVGAQLEYEVGV